MLTPSLQDRLNAIACEACRTKKCKCDRKLPACSQCQSSVTECHYQEGGKRGLPAAYMRALEERLEATEIALSATLITLQNQAAASHIDDGLLNAISNPQSRQKSKAERLADWKRLPLQTHNQLFAWLRARSGEDVAAAVPEPQSHASASTRTVLERLEECDQPIVPNSLVHTPGSSSENQVLPESVHPKDVIPVESCNKAGFLFPSILARSSLTKSLVRLPIVFTSMEQQYDNHASPQLFAENGRPAKRPRTSPRLAREVGLMRSPTDRFTGFVGSASGIFFIRSVYGAINRSQPRSPAAAETPGSDIVPGEDDHLPVMKPDSSDRLWRGAETSPIPQSHIAFEDMVAYSASYFTSWHPFYPFLQAPTVLEYFAEFARKGFPEEKPYQDLRLVILRAIISISLADHRQSSGHGNVQYPACLVFQTYESTLNSLWTILSQPPTLLALQAALSVQLFLISMLRLNAASRLGGLITRMAVQLGLHRCPARFSAFAPEDRELRQRVFWTIYALDRFLSQSMGLPLGLHDNDIDVCFPLTEKHLPTSLEHDNRLRLLHLIAQQAKIRGEIIELRNKSVHFVHHDPDRATAITAKLSQWWNDVEDYIDPDGSYDASPYATAILTLLRHESIISFHRPVLAASHKDAAYDASLHQCINSARSIISSLHHVIQTHSSLGATAEPLTLLWPSCTWAVWISTFILFFAANGGHVDQAVVTRLADKSLRILHHLSKRGSTWPEASSAAIRDLQARMTERATQDATGNTLSSEISNSALIHSSRTDFLPSSARHDPLRSDEAPLITNESATAPNPNPETTQGPAETGPDLGFNSSYWDAYIATEFNDFATLGNSNGLDAFSGFDIPFWFDQEQHWDFPQ